MEYEGTRYAGFQAQKNAPTVQVELEKALKQLTGETTRVVGASRTDASAHGKGQVVSFKTSFAHPTRAFVTGLNHFLPEDIRVQRAVVVPMDFNARRSAKSREYRYAILLRSAPPALFRSLVHCAPRGVDVTRMRDAAQRFVGEHDFTAFCGPVEGTRGSKRRKVMRFEVRQAGPFLYMDVEADAFLPQQVRRMAGALLQVGYGKLTAEQLAQILVSKRSGAGGPSLPAKGLYLMRVNYPDLPQLGEREHEGCENI